MQFREPLEYSLACFFEVNLDLTAVGFADLPAHETERLAAICSNNRYCSGVMPSFCAACSENRSKRRI